MHLSYGMSKYKGRVYKSYALAESYRDGGKVKKRIICQIGKLTDTQAAKIKQICKVMQNEEQVVTRLDDSAVMESSLLTFEECTLAKLEETFGLKEVLESGSCRIGSRNRLIFPILNGKL